ncbi:MAG: FtsK/SpoIIIE domain-containing protein [Solirubrobacterales bacterium]
MVVNTALDEQLLCLLAIQNAVQNYNKGIESIQNNFRNTNQQITKSHSSAIDEIKARADRAIASNNNEHSRILGTISSLRNQIANLELEIQTYDASYKKRKIKRQLDSHADFKYPFSNSDPIITQLRYIEDRIQTIGQNCVEEQNHFLREISLLVSSSRLNMYREIHFLMKKLDALWAQANQAIPKAHQARYTGIVDHTNQELGTATESAKEQLQALKDRIASLEDSVADKLMIDLQIADTKTIRDLVFAVAESEQVFCSPEKSVKTPGVFQCGYLKYDLSAIPSWPFSSVYLKHLYGDFMTTAGDILLPCNMDFQQSVNLFVEVCANHAEEAQQGLQALILKLFKLVPSGNLKCTFFDPSGAGQIFAPFISLREYDDSLISTKIWTTGQQLNQQLDLLNSHIEECVVKASMQQDRSSSCFDEYRVLAIWDFPRAFDEQAIEKLAKIVENGPMCGVSVIIVSNEEFYSDNTKRKPSLMEKMKKSMTEIKSDSDRYFIDFEGLMQVQYLFESLPEPELIDSIIDQVGSQAKASKSSKVTSFDRLIGDEPSLFDGDSRSMLSIPIGVDETNRVHRLEFGTGVSHHALIAGQVGSGKTTLLHTIVMSSLLEYSPDQLHIYLLDFKEGVEFSVYSQYKIPHIKLIALRSDQEYGKLVLEYLAEEINRRAKLFKESGDFQNLWSYRDATKATLPRILLIIDEFQMLFGGAGSSKHASAAARYITQIVRQGRSFGINVIMASQTIATMEDLRLDRQTIDQMAVRIALKCAERDAAAVLGVNNRGMQRIGNERGAAIYNPENGTVESDNVKFNVGFVTPEQRQSMLKMVADCYRDYDDGQAPQVYDGDCLPVIHSDHPICQTNDPNRSQPCVWVGQPLGISPALEIVFQAAKGSHLVVVGLNEDLARKIMLTSTLSLLKQQYEVYFIDHRIQAKNDCLAQLCRNQSSIKYHQNDDDLTDQSINEIHGILEQRMNERQYEAAPIFVVIHGLHRARGIENTVEQRSLSKTAAQTSGQKLIEILKRGPEYQIFCLVWCDSVSTFNNYPLKTLDDFRLKIALEMSAREGTNLMNLADTDSLSNMTAVYYDGINNFVKFRPYQEPDEHLSVQILERSEEALSQV